MSTTKNPEVKEIQKPTKEKIVTQEQFANDSYLDIAVLSQELMSLNEGQLRFKVAKVSEYVFDKTDSNNNPIVNEQGEVEQIRSPYVEIIAEGLKGKIGTKRLAKEQLELLEVNQMYVGKYILSADDKMNFTVDFTSVVPFAQELKTRANNLPKT